MSLDTQTPPTGEDRPRAKGQGMGPLSIAVILLLVSGILTPIAWVMAHRFLPVPGTMLMVERAFEGERLSVQWVNLDRIDPALARSAIGAEDSRFCSHNGFDFEAIERALAANAKATNQKRGRFRGGSTISQQTAKNVFAWADRSWTRKGVETVYTVLIEAFWPKSRIMEAYLNVAEWGDGRFGAEAAARGLFNVAAADLSAADAAALAAVLPSPNRWSAVNPSRRLAPRFASIRARARAVASQNLDDCVFPSAQPARPERPAKRAPPVLPPLAAPPPEDQPADADPSVEDAAASAADPAPPEGLEALRLGEPRAGEPPDAAPPEQRHTPETPPSSTAPEPPSGM